MHSKKKESALRKVRFLYLVNTLIIYVAVDKIFENMHILYTCVLNEK